MNFATGLTNEYPNFSFFDLNSEHDRGGRLAGGAGFDSHDNLDSILGTA